MKTLEVDLHKLSREGLRAYLLLLDEIDPKEVGVALPLGYPDDTDFETETMANPEQQALPDDMPDEPKELSEAPQFEV